MSPLRSHAPASRYFSSSVDLPVRGGVAQPDLEVLDRPVVLALLGLVLRRQERRPRPQHGVRAQPGEDLRRIVGPVRLGARPPDPEQQRLVAGHLLECPAQEGNAVMVVAQGEEALAEQLRGGDVVRVGLVRPVEITGRLLPVSPLRLEAAEGVAGLEGELALRARELEALACLLQRAGPKRGDAVAHRDLRLVEVRLSRAQVEQDPVALPRGFEVAGPEGGLREREERPRIPRVLGNAPGRCPGLRISRPLAAGACEAGGCEAGPPAPAGKKEEHHRHRDEAGKADSEDGEDAHGPMPCPPATRGMSRPEASARSCAYAQGM